MNDLGGVAKMSCAQHTWVHRVNDEGHPSLVRKHDAHTKGSKLALHTRECSMLPPLQFCPIPHTALRSVSSPQLLLLALAVFMFRQGNILARLQNLDGLWCVYHTRNHA